MERRNIPEAIKQWYAQRQKAAERRSLTKEVKNRRKEAAQMRGERDDARYTVERELVIPNRFYQGDLPFTSILVTLTPIKRQRVQNWNGWRVVARLAPPVGQEAALDSTQPVLGQMTCAGLSKKTVMEIADLWVRDSYWWVPEYNNAPVPKNTFAIAATSYLIRKPPTPIR